MLIADVSVTWQRFSDIFPVNIFWSVIHRWLSFLSTPIGRMVFWLVDKILSVSDLVTWSVRLAGSQSYWSDRMVGQLTRGNQHPILWISKLSLWELQKMRFIFWEQKWSHEKDKIIPGAHGLPCPSCTHWPCLPWGRGTGQEDPLKRQNLFQWQTWKNTRFSLVLHADVFLLTARCKICAMLIYFHWKLIYFYWHVFATLPIWTCVDYFNWQILSSLYLCWCISVCADVFLLTYCERICAKRVIFAAICSNRAGELGEKCFHWGKRFPRMPTTQIKNVRKLLRI